MKFRYTPEGAPAREWDYHPSRINNIEGSEIERRTGMKFTEWADAVLEGSMVAMNGLLYIHLKRDIPTLRWDEVVFTLDEVELELELDDKIRMRDGLREQLKAGGVARDNIEIAEQALEELEAEIAQEAPPVEPAPAPSIFDDDGLEAAYAGEAPKA